uniref:Uncharacterized protein n=1 Tax=Chromera velia CCMP2878 TaxID=1169474 RepID=A0A0G4G9I5_9ALVE|mmetsp:Transcript_24175/g.47536  ORF Transcript_24175/g.47536 Transcript_24175/m.47536 type:complete len:341 (-) Transcript_24175:241-1263(-)|eukprot:Cvel_20904.t1-p1 / transcript=Cvel_20904.t1 / gene=Cvel_20904 / organism=Chromera_velia_CCMP2878 / gene_product=hypothetical protein / transcript_product=hypothetical protein / location=Cvel_scaffold1918:917-1936(-) / protein_length=340 / sequence_SO=supercontig / SO=protein_coding / is_pseudo=false
MDFILDVLRGIVFWSVVAWNAWILVICYLWLSLSICWFCFKEGLSCLLATVDLLGDVILHEQGLRSDPAGRKLLETLFEHQTEALSSWATVTRLASIVSGRPLQGYPVAETSSVWSLKAVRKQTIDRVLGGVLQAGISQIFLFCPGFSGRSLSDSLRSSKVFEIDDKRVQEAKRDIVGRSGKEAANLTFIPLETGPEKWGPGTQAFPRGPPRGFEKDAKSVVVSDGFTLRLSEEEGLLWLKSVAATVAPGSFVTFEFLTEKGTGGDLWFKLLQLLGLVQWKFSLKLKGTGKECREQLDRLLKEKAPGLETTEVVWLAEDGAAKQNPGVGIAICRVKKTGK